MEISGKTFLVTGAARRIGRALSLRLAERGGRVILHFNRSRDDAEKTLAELPGTGHRLAGPVDFASPLAAEQLFSIVRECDGLVNNASLYRARGDDPSELEERYFTVNVHTPTALMRFFSAAKRPGVIVNLLDQAAMREHPASDPYTCSRRALLEETLRAAVEFAPLGIRVNGVAPGPVLPPVGLEDSKMTKELRSVPLGRPVGVADLIDAIEFLIVNDSVTGAILPVDCGQHLSGRA